MVSQDLALRVGVIGYGSIGRRLVSTLRSDSRFDIAFVHNRTSAATADLPKTIVLPDLANFKDRKADLIVEVSHPAYTIDYGETFLSEADYLPLSTSALVDDDLRSRLLVSAQESGRTLYLPHGALVGLESLIASREIWEAITITFIKNPAHISADGGSTTTVTGETVLYEGSVRGIASRYPQNVNAMVTLALATLGVDRCIARLVADPTADSGILDVMAQGTDGSTLHIRRDQPMVGVSGTEMFDALMSSLYTVTGVRRAGISFV